MFARFTSCVFAIAALSACSSDTSDKAQSQRGDAASAREPDAATPGAIELCSGCPDQSLDRSDARVRFHHVHLNVTDPSAEREFYAKFFAAEAVRLNRKADVLWLSPMLCLFHEQQSAPDDTLEMGLDHFGRGSKDVVQWFEQASMAGIVGDPRQGFEPMPAQVGDLTFVYLRGPGAERIEVYSAGAIVIPEHEVEAETFQHVHFLTPDVDATVDWYTRLLQLPANPSNGLGRDITVDRVSLFFASYYQPSRYVPSDDRPLGHIAFSVTDLDALRARAGMLEIEIVSEPEWTAEGFRSFFVRGPQEVLLEFVEAGAIDPQQ